MLLPITCIIISQLYATHSTNVTTFSVPVSANLTTTNETQTQASSQTVINESKTLQNDFRPSPQFDHYEHNKFPVVPAMPEAKHFSSGSVPWFPASRHTTQTPWTTKIAFPQPTVETAKERPYPFVGGTNSRTFGFETAKPTGYGVSSGGSSGPEKYNSWDKFETGVKKPGYSPGFPDKGGVNPVKKILGLLAAFIPIGLLLSALTPSVVQVVPVNMSQTRSRADANSVAKRLISSLNKLEESKAEGCEERVLCELLLSAGVSKNAEQHVENFLQRFSEQEGDAAEKAEELQRVYEGVHKQNCKILKCRNIKEDSDVK